ncbi:MAG: s-methyl-5-thioribose-1-phosphate isomerase [Prochlorothrix sp.]|nr:s-methyl-5-thioribose-1-phosphate isomerase [Prochlorothrix sp.]
MNRQHIYPLVWHQDHLLVIDQTRLPRELSIIEVRRFGDLIEAIERHIIQGTELLQLAAAYGLCLQAEALTGGDRSAFLDQLSRSGQGLEPRAGVGVALQIFRQEVERLAQDLAQNTGTVADLKAILLQQVQDSHRSQLQRCYDLAEAGTKVLPSQPQALRLLTYGNGGSLATVGYGTSLGVVRRLWDQKRLERVYIAETRPLLQGAKLAAWECAQEGIPVTVVADNAAAVLMQQGLVDAVVVGATAIAANGDVIHDIGTYGLALVAKAHDVPFMVVAPQEKLRSTLATGAEYSPAALSLEAWSQVHEILLYPGEVSVYPRSEDVTPAALITAIVTENGVQAFP